MSPVQQITIHPREIPPRRKFKKIPDSVFKRPFDKPRRIGSFPAPEPPPLRDSAKIKTFKEIEKKQKDSVLAAQNQKAVDAYQITNKTRLKQALKAKAWQGKEQAPAVQTVSKTPQAISPYYATRLNASAAANRKNSINILA